MHTQSHEAMAAGTAVHRPEALPDLFAPYLAAMRIEQGRSVLDWQGKVLSSAYQPIVSFIHSRIVGHEALVRGCDEHGAALSPPTLFDLAERRGELVWLDRACRILHVFNVNAAAGWLFLNIHPAVFGGGSDGECISGMLRDILQNQFGWDSSRCVLEVVEEGVTDIARLEEGVQQIRALGVGLAIDDFGAGHSNFDRIWRLRPDVVKLDRSFTERATNDITVRRTLPRLVGLLHEAGTLVLMEGVETFDQAQIAMDADVDFGQGWYFARPAARPLADPDALAPLLGGVWAEYDEKMRQSSAAKTEQLAAYRNAIGYGAVLLASGLPIAVAAEGFLQLGHAQCVYLLDQEGRQIGCNISHHRMHAKRILEVLGQQSGARWSRRPYYQRARQHPGTPQLTRPYVSIASGRSCVTVSIATRLNDQMVVLCGDIDWELLGQSQG